MLVWLRFLVDLILEGTLNAVDKVLKPPPPELRNAAGHLLSGAEDPGDGRALESAL